MRKIISKKELDKKIRKKQFIAGAILILIMVLSTLGFAFTNKNEDTERIEYKGIEFFKDGGYWYFNINGQSFVTINNPKETEDINFFNYALIQNYANKPLYFSGEQGEHFFEIERNLNRYVLRIGNACLNNEKCIGDFPLKNCSDNVIVYKEAVNESEKIYQEENCVFIISGYQNQTKYADKFLFSILGI